MTSSTAAAPAAAPPPRRPVLRPLADVLPGRTPPVESARPDPTPPPPPDPHVQAMAERVLRGAVEIVGGLRPPRQLATVLRPALLEYLVGLRGAHLAPRLCSVRAQQPVGGVVEAVAVVALRTGVRAVCARFERPPGSARWRCTALHVTLTQRDVRPVR
ncbi:MAG: Rv3235 family protein [Pseudonocardiaceae bacterium]